MVLMGTIQLSREMQDRRVEYFVSSAAARASVALAVLHRNTSALYRECFKNRCWRNNT